MPVELVAFVCEGPTCEGRWDEKRAGERVARLVTAHGPGARQACVVSEICLGHCQRGPNLMIMPVAEAEASIARWLRPDLSVPGARIHHPPTVARAAEQILESISRISSGAARPAASAPDTELPVAANPELA